MNLPKVSVYADTFSNSQQLYVSTNKFAIGQNNCLSTIPGTVLAKKCIPKTRKCGTKVIVSHNFNDANDCTIGL